MNTNEVRTIDWTTYNPNNIVFEVVSTNTKTNSPIVRVEDRTLFPPGCPMKIHIFTPPLVTNFPKLGPDSVPSWGGKIDSQEVNKQELDLSMKGASPPQLQFRKWMETFDDILLNYMMTNQRFLGKSGESKEAIKMMQKRAFRKRVSMKTGQEYPDSWTIRCPKYSNDTSFNYVPIYDANGDMVPWTADNSKTIVKFNDVLQASIRYDGIFIRPGMFGHSWTLMAIKNFGTIISTVEESKKYLQERPFPDLNDETDFPRLCVRD